MKRRIIIAKENKEERAAPAGKSAGAAFSSLFGHICLVIIDFLSFSRCRENDVFQPRGAQIEALCALEDSRAEGAVKGLVQAATGVGKTYLAAFDSANYQRVLFVAHREEILKQAAVSFKNVRHSDDYRG